MPLSPKVIAITENLDFASTSKHSLICPIKDSNCVLVCLNPPQPSVAFHIKTDTGFYMKCNLRLLWVTWIKNMMKVNNKNRRTRHLLKEWRQSNAYCKLRNIILHWHKDPWWMFRAAIFTTVVNIKTTFLWRNFILIEISSNNYKTLLRTWIITSSHNKTTNKTKISTIKYNRIFNLCKFAQYINYHRYGWSESLESKYSRVDQIKLVFKQTISLQIF